MSNKVKELDIKNQSYYFFDDIINIKDFDPNNIKMCEKSNKNVLISYTGYVTMKDIKYIKINNVSPLYFIFNKMNGHFEETNAS